MYADKQKSQELFSLLRLKFPEGLNSLGSNTIIHQSRNIVKGKQEVSQKKDYGETRIMVECPETDQVKNITLKNCEKRKNGKKMNTIWINNPLEDVPNFVRIFLRKVQQSGIQHKNN